MNTTGQNDLFHANLRRTPISVFVSIGGAIVLACLVVVRILWTYQQAGKPMTRGLMYAALFALLIFSNALSLLTRSKTGYILVMVAALTPALGSLALSLHFFTILLVGKFLHDQIGFMTSLIGLLQFTVILILMASLLRKEAREWVWKP